MSGFEFFSLLDSMHLFVNAVFLARLIRQGYDFFSQKLMPSLSAVVLKERDVSVCLRNIVFETYSLRSICSEHFGQLGEKENL